MIGIIAAMQKEADSIIAAMNSPRKEVVGGISFTLGKIGECEIVLSVCGVGKVFAAMCAEAMIIKYSPLLIINTGVGGTLTNELSIGDIAIAAAVCQHDMDTTAIGDELGLISGINQVYFEADKSAIQEISAIASEMGIHTKCGIIASGDIFVAASETKQKIIDTFGAIACEMEGGAIGHVCFVNKIPFAVIRAISDDADGGACEDYPAFAAKSAAVSAELVCRFARMRNKDNT